MNADVPSGLAAGEGAACRSAPRDGKTERAPLPSRAEVVVVGAGVIGASFAYHLTKLGCRNVLVLERKSIGSGTSWHSHGVVGLVRSSPTLLRMAMETARMMDEVEAASELSTGYSVRGSVNVTATPGRMMQFRRFADVARAEGLPIEVIDGHEAKRLYPHLAGDDLLGGIHLPTEGQCNPLDLTHALLGAARKGGARIMEQTACTGLQVTNGRITAVETSSGVVECDTFVNCTGLWGRDFLRKETGGLPLQGVEHNYLVTEFSADITAGLPLLRDPDFAMTLREDARQFSVGFNDREAKIFAADKVPETFEFDELPPDWDAAMPYLTDAIARVPLLGELGIRHFMCGPESVTPDTRYLLGPWGPPNAWVAAGFSGIGVGSSGGAGLVLAHWVLEGSPPGDMWDVDARRMLPFQSNRNYLATRSTEASGLLFAVNWPHRQNRSARGIRRSPLHDAMKRANGVFSEVAGWEVSDWFAPTPDDMRLDDTFGEPSWTSFASAEVEAARNACVICDQTALTKFLVVGPEAEAALSQLLTRAAPRKVGGTVVAAMLNVRGGVEAVFNVIKWDENEFMLIADGTAAAYLLAGIRGGVDSWPGAHVVDITSAYAVIDMIGPQADAALQRAGWRGSAADLATGSADASAEIGYATATLFAELRLGIRAWRAVVPSEFAQSAFEALRGSDDDGVRPLGRHAYRFLRTNAGSPLWGEAMDRYHTPFESGLHALVDLTDGRPFPGHDVCLQQARDGVTRALVRVTLRQNEIGAVIGHEPIYLDGARKGAIEQGAYALAGDDAGGVGLGYLHLDSMTAVGSDLEGRCEVEIGGAKIEARYETPTLQSGAPAPDDTRAKPLMLMASAPPHLRT